MKWSLSLILGLCASIVLLVAMGCARDAPKSALEQHSSAREVEQATTQATPTPLESEEGLSGELDTDVQSECQEGQLLTPGDRCTYPGTTDEFWVDDAGVGHFLFFSARSVINAQNARINNNAYDFAARKGQNGNWTIEVVGIPSDSVKVSDIVVASVDTPTPTTLTVSEPTPLLPPSPVPTSYIPLPSITPTSTLVPRPTATPTSELIPPLTPTATATRQATLVPPHSSPVPTPSPDSPAAVASVVPSPIPSAVAQPPLKPAIEDIPYVNAEWGDQVVEMNESVVLNLAHAFPETMFHGFRRYRALVGNSAVGAARVDSHTGLLTLSATMPGTTWVAIQACDSRGCSRLGEATIRLTVPPLPNRPPQAVGNVEDQQVHVGESVSISVANKFWDLEGDPVIRYELAFADDTLATVSDISPDGIVIVEGTQTGTTSVSIHACDRESCGLEELAQKFDLEVMPARNKPPVAYEGIADQTVNIGQTVSLDLNSIFDDPEGDPIEEYGFSQGDRRVIVGTVHPEAGRLTLRGAEVGTTFATVDARDSKSGSSSVGVTFRVTVTQPPRDPPRVVSAISDRVLELGDAIYVPVSYAFVTSPRYRVTRYDFLLRDPEVAMNSEISRDGVLKLEGSEEGRSWVSVRACNYVGCSNFSELSFVVIVIDSDNERNTRPEVVGALLDRRLSVGETVSLNVSRAFSDPDDDAIVDYHYEMSNPRLASGSSISNTGILILRGSKVGTTSVSVSACDDEDECSDPEEMKFTLTVEAAQVKDQ